MHPSCKLEDWQLSDNDQDSDFTDGAQREVEACDFEHTGIKEVKAGNATIALRWCERGGRPARVSHSGLPIESATATGLN